MARVFIPTDVASIDNIVRLDVDPNIKLAAAVVIQAVDDMSKYPSRRSRKRKDASAVDAIKKADERRAEAEDFFMTDRCIGWLTMITSSSQTPEQLRDSILSDEIQRRRSRISPIDRDNYWQTEAARIQSFLDGRIAA